MNSKTNYYLIIFLLVFISCDKTKPEAGTQVETVETIDEASNLSFEVHLKTSAPDNFRFFANEVFMNNSQFMNLSITHKLNANETEKTMYYEFPENIKPDHQLGFALGNKSEKEVEIIQATLKYGDLEYVMTSDNILNYFTTNRFVEYDSVSKKLKTKRVDNRLNPMLFVRMRILDSIQNQD